MRKIRFITLSAVLFLSFAAHAEIFGRITGIVHDPQHRPISGAQITLLAAHSALTYQSATNTEGAFSIVGVPLGDYNITVSQTGFAAAHQSITLASDTSPVLHFALQVGMVTQNVSVPAESGAANAETATPITLIDRIDIAQTPGADRSNSMAMITDYVPGAYMSHDMLHMRGGHQIGWLVDGVQIPNTNIATNLGAQIDPKDIDYVEVLRGSYTADAGDRTYGIFNVVPRTGFERNRNAELVVTAGNFWQTNEQISLGDHDAKSAYYASLNGNRSDYGLSTPIGPIHHDAANGYGGFASFINNHSDKDQYRLVAQARTDFFQIPYDPNPNSFENQQFDSSGLRDTQTEHDAYAALTWLHTFSRTTVLQVSPYFHSNAADYDSIPSDTPVATTSHRTSIYAGGQGTLSTVIARNTVQAGVSGYGQHDSNLYGAIFNDGSGNPNFSTPDFAAGGVVEEFVSDSFKASNWLTLTGGVRQTHFQGQFSEDVTAPRVGIAVLVPKLKWALRGFYGRFYQPPPLLTASGPIVQYAQANDTSFVSLHGERDEEHQFGVQIPWRGWLLDADTFKTRANNFLDHSNVGDSSIFYPITVDGALVRAWELTLRSPRLWNHTRAHLAYSNQIAEQRGNITGGLVCIPLGSPACNAGFAYTPVDHDQRDTLNAGFDASLPRHITVAANLFYGSGFVNGDPDPTTPYPNPYLPEHTTFDAVVGKDFGERATVSVTAINVANRRVLLDNSLTFGGFHYNDPRAIYAELRYRFHY
jgi:hypothetical protein